MCSFVIVDSLSKSGKVLFAGDIIRSPSSSVHRAERSSVINEALCITLFGFVGSYSCRPREFTLLMIRIKTM